MSVAMPYGWGRVPFGYEDRLRWRRLPFPDAEYEQRIERVRGAMAREGVDCLLVLGRGNDTGDIRYLTNFEDLYGGETVVVVPAEGEVVFVTNAVMHGEPMHSGVPDVWPREVRAAAAPRTVTGDARVPTVAYYVGEALGELGSGALIGLVGEWPESLLDEIGLSAGRRVQRGMTLLREARAIKSPLEVELLRRAAALADDAAVAAMAAAVAGASEHDIAAAANEAMFRGGAEHPAFPISVVAGARAGLKHMAPSDYRIERGDMVFIDLGAKLAGYCSDCSRQTVCGKPSDEQRRFMETQAEMVEAVSALIKPGSVIGELAKVAEEIAKREGYSDYLYFRGHGVGCGLADKPALAPGNPAAFEQGMVFALEPMLVKFGFGTACWEDIWHVTADGVERLNQSSPRFWAAT